MRRPLVALRLFDSVQAGLDAAREHGVHHFPVCHHDRVIGMVCACELSEARAGESVGDVMHPAVMLPESRPAEDAAMLMRAAAVGCVLLTDGLGEACEFVTRSELGRDPRISSLFEDYRCERCRAIHHRHRGAEGQLCLACRAQGDASTTRESGIYGSGVGA